MTLSKDIIAFVGSYSLEDTKGGVTVIGVNAQTGNMKVISKAAHELEAGYLCYAPQTQMLYAVDERKADGRGPVGPKAAVHAFAFDDKHQELEWKCAEPTFGAFPTFLSYCKSKKLLVSANHGSFDHTEQVMRTPSGGWAVTYHYDASTLVTYSTDDKGLITGVTDVHVLNGHGTDPNSSPQAGGHAQSGAHAHCAVLDPSRKFVVVCDKGTDQILVFRLGTKLELVSNLKFPAVSGPRHLVFNAAGTKAFMTLEFTSELASLNFDPHTGKFEHICSVSTLTISGGRVNEPAEIRLHPNEKFVYINNRGEDNLVCFDVLTHASPALTHQVAMAASIHPGLAARSFAIDPSGTLLLFADRPANCVRQYRIDGATGALTHVGDCEMTAPVFIAFA